MPYVTCYTSRVSSCPCSPSCACSYNFSFKVLKSCNRHFCDTYMCLKAWAPKLFIYRLLHAWLLFLKQALPHHICDHRDPCSAPAALVFCSLLPPLIRRPEVVEPKWASPEGENHEQRFSARTGERFVMAGTQPSTVGGWPQRPELSPGKGEAFAGRSRAVQCTANK